MYGLLKLHKKDAPIRPVCSYINAPCKKLSSALIPIIKKYTAFKPQFSIKNSYELVNKIKHVKLEPTYLIASFDVVNLFPSIPGKDVEDIIKDLLLDGNTNPVVSREILQLLSLCLNQNYLQFNDNFYKPTTGLPMGSPLSPLLPEIFMNHLENKIQQLPLAKNLIYWHRYVDDVLIMWKGTKRQLDLFHQQLNSLHITITLEIEHDRKINFLDLSIGKDQFKTHVFDISQNNAYRHNHTCILFPSIFTQ